MKGSTENYLVSGPKADGVSVSRAPDGQGNPWSAVGPAGQVGVGGGNLLQWTLTPAFFD